MPRRPQPEIKTITTEDGYKVSFIPNPVFDEPNEGSNHINLLPPYTRGDGEHGSPILLYSDKPFVEGDILRLHDGKDTPVHIQKSYYLEDFFENVYVAITNIVSASPDVKIGTGVQSASRMVTSRQMHIMDPTQIAQFKINP